MTRSRSQVGSLVSVMMVATPFGCVVSKQLGDEAESSDGTSTETPEVPKEDAVAAIIAARCEAHFACECESVFPDTVWASQAECESALQTAFELLFESSEAAGRTYDPDCVAAYIDFYQAPDCSPAGPAQALAWDAVMHCPFFHGDLPVGAACEGHEVLMTGATDCSEGLVCTGVSCQPRKAIGEPCESDAQFSEQECEYDAFCDLSATPPSCAPRPGAAEPCVDDLCAVDAYCRDDVCEAKRAPGEPCTFALECAYGICDPETFTCVGVPAACSPWTLVVEDTCDFGQHAAADFVENNSSCETADDCIALEAFCVSGNTCGQIAVDVDYDVNEWATITNALGTCEDCGADPCGAGVACIDGTCGFEFG